VLYHNNIPALYTDTDGIIVEDTDGNDPKITLRDNAQATIASLGSIDGVFYIYINAGAENAITAASNGAVSLYYDNNIKLATSNTGGTLTGVLVADGLTLGDNEYIILGDGPEGRIYSNNTDIVIANGAMDETMATFTQNGTVDLYYDNVVTFSTAIGGIIVADDSGTNPKIQLQDDAGNPRGSLDHSSGALKLYNNIAQVEFYHTGALTASTTGVHGLNIHNGAEYGQWYHDATDVYLKNATHSGWIRLTGEDSVGGAATMATFDPDGASTLYYDDNIKLYTETDGIAVTSVNHSTNEQFEIYSDANHWYLESKFSSGNVNIKGRTAGGSAGRNMIVCNPDGGVDLYYNNNKMYEGLAAGHAFYTETAGNMVLEANGDDIRYRHTGAGDDVDFTVRNAANGANEVALKLIADGGVELYYDNVKTLNTTATGFETTDGTDIADFEMSGGNFEIKNTHDGGFFALKRMHTTSVERTILSASDSGVEIYDTATNAALATSSVGLKTTTSAGYHAQMRFDGTQFNVTSYQHGGNIGLRNEDAGGTMQDLVIGDPDGSVDLYYDGTKTAWTIAEGLETKGTIQFPATAVADADANALDDYEEGTWTPTAADAASGGNTGGTGFGIYTKVGRSVTATCVLANIDTTGLTAGNVFYLQGLPFAAEATRSYLGSCATDSVNHDAATVNIASRVSASQSSIYFMETRDNTTVLNMIVSQVTDDTSDIWLTITYNAA
jgi:hypothetical protein